MNTGRYRGLFWSPEGEPVPGALEVSETGDVQVELQGQLIEGQGSLREASLIEGEIADSPFPGPMVTLSRCVRARRKVGPGGPLEKWMAQLSLVGRDCVGPDATFTRVLLGLRGLNAFLGGTPRNPDSGHKGWISVRRFTVDDWEVDFGWRVTGQTGATYQWREWSPFIEVVLEQPCTVDEILRRVVPVFESILTIAGQRHAGVEQITVGLAQGRDSFRVLAPRVEVSSPGSQERELFNHELSFDIESMPGGSALIQRVRQLLSQQPEFTAIFLGQERAPPIYVEDLLRVSVLALAYLAGAFPEVVEGARRHLARFETAPAEVRAFLPSAGLVAVPALVRELLTPGFCSVLGMASKEVFAERIAQAFRWVSLRDGEEFPLQELVQLRHQIRALLYLSLLRLLGFESEDAELRVGRAIKWRGLP